MGRPSLFNSAGTLRLLATCTQLRHFARQRVPRLEGDFRETCAGGDGDPASADPPACL
jgi:hypothetical protein